MDFLETAVRRNSKLVDSAFELHRNGEIPPNTYVVDLDSVKHNAQAIADSAKASGIKNYFMTKQFGWNPLISKVIIDSGIKSAVALDIEEAKGLHRCGIKVDHVGHVVQIPTSQIDFAISQLRPEVVTIYNYDKAEEVNRAAAKIGIKQNVMLRPIGPSDSFGNTLEGGTPLRELTQTVKKMAGLKNIHVMGLTSFPSFRYDLKLGKNRRTVNFETLKRSQKLIENECGIRIEQINAPGSNCASSMSILAEEGATHGEPGHAFTGTTPWHAFADLPEIPAWVYVTEVSHVAGDRAFSFSGGLPQSGYCGFFTPHYHQNFVYALVENSENRHFVLAEPPPLVNDVQAWPDYYTVLHCSEDFSIRSGQSVVFGFRPQLYVSRSRLAIVKGVGTTNQKVLGIFDRHGNLLDQDDGPAPRSMLVELMAHV